MSDRDRNPEKAVNGLISVLEDNLPTKIDALDTAYDDELTPMADIVAWYRAPLLHYPAYPVQVVACSDSDIPGETLRYGIHVHQVFVETIVRARRTATYQGVTIGPSEIASLWCQRYAEATELVILDFPRLTVSGTVQVSRARTESIAYSAVRGVPNEEEMFEKRCALTIEIHSTPT